MGGLSFLYPAMLAGLLLLPVLWLIIRSAPRHPRKVVFPAARLLIGLSSTRRDAQRAPLWQTILRSLILLALILAAARPVLNRTDYSNDRGAIFLIVDNGWSSAAQWEDYRKGLHQVANQARLSGQSVYMARTAPEAFGATSARLPEIEGPLSPRATEAAIDRMQPMPWAPDYHALATAISGHQDMVNAMGSVIWLTNDLEEPGKAELARDLDEIAPVTLLHGQSTDVYAIRSLMRNRTGMQVRITHNPGDITRKIDLVARDRRGQVLLRKTVDIAPRTGATDADIPLPSDIANSIQTLGIAGIESAASVFQTGARWQQRKVGVIVSSGEGPVLLSDRYFFLDRAISPYADLHYDTLEKLLEDKVDIMVVAGPIPGLGAHREQLMRWINDGGMLVRFAGDTGTGGEQGTDPTFLPVTLRLGNRDFGGSMSWERPKHLLSFPENSPFFGLSIPDEITVNRQLLAEPDPDIVKKTWARLADGTPLITSAPRNAGRIVLFHVTPWADWSDLPMSGLFVEIWQKLLPLARPGESRTNELETMLPPQSVLDGFGRAHQPDAVILPVHGKLPQPDPRHPPGIFGRNGQAVALNLGPYLDGLDRKIRWPEGVSQRMVSQSGQTDLAALCLVIAILLLLIDMIIIMVINHLSSWRNRPYHGDPNAPRPGEHTAKSDPASSAPREKVSTLNTIGILVLIGAGITGLFGLPAPAKAANSTSYDAALHPRLAYIETGVAPIDRLSQAGLSGLTEILRRRTAADLATPDGVDPQTDDLSFYPLIYWPLVDGQEPLSQYARDMVNQYLHGGGMILIDSRDREVEPARLRRLLAGIEIPVLDRAPADDVVFRSFYLLDRAYGRFDAPLWADARPNPRFDGVASVLFGGNDWASAWVLPHSTSRQDDGIGFQLAPDNPRPSNQPDFGSALNSSARDDISPRQRELALRFGVNVVMYALTGSYKGDQVHLPAILERLGR